MAAHPERTASDCGAGGCSHSEGEVDAAKPNAAPNVKGAMSWRALLIALAVWGMIYLPALGTLDMRGEEARRALPAARMLETGNFIVPYIGSDPYLRKPPLINWLIAASFKLTGQRTEFSARIPSILAVLAVAVTFLSVARRSLGETGALAGALMWLACLGIIVKGRTAEIEALYASLTGIACICWLTFWKERRSPWLLWVVPSIFLGLALLAKGPTHLIFFYGTVVGVLWKQRELRRIWSFPHLAGAGMMLLIFALWLAPYLIVLENSRVADVWSRELTGRVVRPIFHFHNWLLNVPKALWYLLPWTLLLPFVRVSRVADERDRKLLVGLACGIAAPLLLVLLMPAAMPRYALPLVAASVWLTAFALRENAIVLQKPARWIFAAVGMTCAATLLYAVAIAPRLGAKSKVRPNGVRVNAIVPESARIFAVSPEFQPYLFYVRAPITYVDEVASLPADARYVLVRQGGGKKTARANREIEALQPRPLLSLSDERGHRSTLYELTQSVAP